MSAALRSSFSYPQRLAEAQTKLRLFENKMKVMGPVTLSIAEFNSSPSADQKKNIIKVPSWFLFQYEDIPSQFRLSGFDDPRLVDQNFLSEFAAWINGRITESGLSSICHPADFGILQTLGLLMRNPDLYEKGKDFLLGHELGHLSHHQRERLDHFWEEIKTTVAIGGIAVGFSLAFVVIAIASVVPLSVTVGVCGVSIAMTSAGVLALINQPKPLSRIEQEKKADLDAVKMLGCVDGGVYYFQTHMRRNLGVRANGAQDIDERGNNLCDKTHPPLSERVECLNQWRANLPAAPQTVRLAFARGI